MENERLELLVKPLWSRSEIAFYFDIGNTLASNIMHKAKMKKTSILVPQKAYRDEIFKVMNLDIEQELKLWRKNDDGITREVN